MSSVYAKILGTLFLGVLFIGVTYFNFSKPAVSPREFVTDIKVEIPQEIEEETVLPAEPEPQPEHVREIEIPEVSAVPRVQINDTQIKVEIVRTNEAITKGLSGRPSLPEDTGMLFIFSRPDLYRFWMPDMNFAIDIIWIQNSKVVAIDRNVSPIFDPENPKLYSPPEPVQYVLEVNAGFTERSGINVGDRVSFRGV